MRKSEVPFSAVEWFNKVYPGSKKVRWYAEQSSGKSSFEAKTKYKGNLHSVEFSEEGKIEDIEIQREWSELPVEVQAEITKYLTGDYTRQKIRKIQEQWTGPSQRMEKAVAESEPAGVYIQYEIEYYGVDESTKALWEGLFDQNGSFIEKREIILRPTDNLNY